MAQFCIAWHHNRLLDIFYIFLIFYRHTILKFYQSLGMCQPRSDAEYEWTVIFLAQLISHFDVILCLRAVGRLQYRQLCRSCHHSGILLILGTVESRIIRNDDDKASIHAHVGHRVSRVRSHIKSHMLHTGHRAYAYYGRSNRHFCGDLLIRRPFAV